MKKLKLKYKHFLLIKSAEIEKKYLKARRILNKKKQLKFKNRYKTKTKIKINAPEAFYIGNTHEDSVNGFSATRVKLINFIETIKKSLMKNLNVQISFKNTKKLSPDGTIIFVAEFGKILDAYPNRITIDYLRDEVVEQLFQHIGLFERLGMTPRKKITDDSVRHWDYIYDISADTSEFKKLFEKYSQTISEEVRSGLFDSMSEAVTNSIQHAYPCSHITKCDCQKGWWMFAKKIDNTLTVVIYDMGIGIPTSIERKPEIKEILANPIRKLRKKNDSLLIKIAAQSRRTTTKMSYRGKGLPDMLEFVRRSNIGEFIIFSRAGSLIYKAQEEIEIGNDYSIPIKGTFIAWNIPLTTENEKH
ncbi:MAG: hypothetical protein H6937_12170 [Burkholderiales bacterium]|nr:hypothetical protein [Burkholderiales bacterium]